LNKWILELKPEEKKYCHSRGYNIKYTHEQKKAVISLCTRNKPAKEVAAKYGTIEENPYNWKRQLLKEKRVYSMDKKSYNKSKDTKPIEAKATELEEEKDDLSLQVIELRKEVHRLKIERDIYEKAAEIIKKDRGINIKTLTNREKDIIINALKEKYSLKELLGILNMAKSSYFYQEIAINTDKYAELRIKARDIFKESSSRYGYRRIHSLIRTAGMTVSEKVIRRIMKEEKLIVPYIKQRKYNSYKGEISPEVENIIDRDFHADKPNTKWLTDLT